MARRLPKAAVDKIEDAVDELFEKAKLRLLGPKFTGKKLFISYNRHASLPGLYEAAHLEQGGIPDVEHLDQLLRTASNYLDATRLKAKNQVVVACQNYVQDVSKYRKRGDPPPDLQEALGNELKDLWVRISAEVKRIADTEAQNVRNVGAVESIIRVNAAAGIDDPVVFWVVVRDQHLCDECKRLHLCKNGKTPRLYKLSEVGHDYHKKGEEQPKVGGLHPHCRCSMAFLMPGFGFDKAGMATWKGEKHDEYAKQKRLGY